MERVSGLDTEFRTDIVMEAKARTGDGRRMGALVICDSP
jgi:hypothetical protein